MQLSSPYEQAGRLIETTPQPMTRQFRRRPNAHLQDLPQGALDPGPASRGVRRRTRGPRRRLYSFLDRCGGLLVAVFVEKLGAALRWEPSRGGALFPHLYGTFKPVEAAWVKPLPLGTDGAHLFPEDMI